MTGHRPSRSELDQVGEGEAKIESAEIPEAIEIAPAAVLGSSTRGTILHKLIEEVLTVKGETRNQAGSATEAQIDLRLRGGRVIMSCLISPDLDLS